MNIRVDLNYPIKDGTEVVFRSPVDCSQVTGLKVYYKEDGNTDFMEFAFADAHGNNVGDIDHLFAENVVVKVILDVTTGMAFVQNADTNAYIERTFVKTVNGENPDKNGNVKIDCVSSKEFGQHGNRLDEVEHQLGQHGNRLDEAEYHLEQHGNRLDEVEAEAKDKQDVLFIAMGVSGYESLDDFFKKQPEYEQLGRRVFLNGVEVDTFSDAAYKAYEKVASGDVLLRAALFLYDTGNYDYNIADQRELEFDSYSYGEFFFHHYDCKNDVLVSVSCIPPMYALPTFSKGAATSLRDELSTKTEQWTFELSDGTIVTKDVMLG